MIKTPLPSLDAVSWCECGPKPIRRRCLSGCVIRIDDEAVRIQTFVGAGAAGETDLVEDAEFLSRLSGYLFSSGLHVSIYGLFNSCGTAGKHSQSL